MREIKLGPKGPYSNGGSPSNAKCSSCGAYYGQHGTAEAILCSGSMLARALGIRLDGQARPTKNERDKE